MNILVISDNENSGLIKQLNKKKAVPIIRRTIIAAMDILRHQDINSIIFDKQHRHIDVLEFILNVRDIDRKVPIYVPQEFLENENWSKVMIQGWVKPLNKDLALFN